MPYYRGVAAKVMVYAYDKTTGLAKTGDAANITAYWSKDGGNGAATNDVNPAAVTNMDGYYAFDMLAAEMTADRGVILPVSATANIIVERKEILTQPKPLLTGSVNDAGADTDDFDTTLTGLGNNFLDTNSILVFTSGNLCGLGRPVDTYTSVSGNIIVSPAFPAAPDNGSEFIIIGYVS